jgi:aminoglycoside 3-N-acetyltransferase
MGVNGGDVMPEGRESISRERLVEDLRALGVRDGDALLVHASLSGLGWVEGGAETVVDALMEAVGPSGTVLFPTLTGTADDGPEHPPVIELATTPCWTGAIPETARRRPDAIRSIHPTHSVSAIGARAKAYTAGHEGSRTPCDGHSPYVRLMDDGGKILLLGGVTHESNTSLHALEEMAAVPYHLQEEETDGIVALPDGTRIVVRNRLHLWRWERDFTKIAPYLQRAGASVTGPVGTSTSTLVSASGLRDVVLPLLHADPLFLLAPTAREEFAGTIK